MDISNGTFHPSSRTVTAKFYELNEVHKLRMLLEVHDRQ